jgi:hypothetical protein
MISCLVICILLVSKASANNTNTPSVNSGEDFHQLEQIYFQRISKKMRNLSQTIQINHPNPSDFAVALSTKVVTYGGFGNFIGSVVTAGLVSFLSDRVLVLNNALFRSMFQHPDPSLSFNSLNITRETVMYCPSAPNLFLAASRQSHHKIIGVNRGDQYLTHHQPVLEWYSTTLSVPIPVQTPESPWRISENRLSYDLAQWLLSHPTPEWETILKKRAKMVFANCSHADTSVPQRASVGLQIRTFADLGRKSSPELEKCYIDCALNLTSHLYRRQRKHRPICVLVTSDDSRLTDRVVDELQKVPYVIAVHNDYPTSSTLSHSGNLLMSQREDDSFSLQSIKDHPEFVDWMLLSDSETAVYSQSSTFASSARHRAGIYRAKDDHVVGFSEGYCACNPVSHPGDIEGLGLGIDSQRR